MTPNQPQPPRMSPVIVYGGGGCLGIVVLLLAVLSLGFAVSRVHLALKAPSFVETQGSVTGAKIRDDDGLYAAVLDYRYVVGSKQWTGTAEVAPAQPDKLKARELIQQYPIGAAIAVYYDPDKPSRSLLNRNVSVLSPSLLAGVWPILFLGALVVMAIVLYRRQAAAKASAVATAKR